jgi:hypothetical protein
VTDLRIALSGWFCDVFGVLGCVATRIHPVQVVYPFPMTWPDLYRVRPFLFLQGIGRKMARGFGRCKFAFQSPENALESWVINNKIRGNFSCVKPFLYRFAVLGWRVALITMSRAGLRVPQRAACSPRSPTATLSLARLLAGLRARFATMWAFVVRATECFYSHLIAAIDAVTAFGPVIAAFPKISPFAQNSANGLLHFYAPIGVSYGAALGASAGSLIVRLECAKKTHLFWKGRHV